MCYVVLSDLTWGTGTSPAVVFAFGLKARVDAAQEDGEDDEDDERDPLPSYSGWIR